MERCYELQLERMLAQAEVPPEVTEGLLTRLEAFVLPFTAALAEPEQRRHTVAYLTGLLSKLERKTAEGIAYLHDRERQGLQKFIGDVPWGHQPLLVTLARQVGADLGESDGVIVFDPSAFAKKGTKSVGVARQWCGRLGKVENCQVGVYMAYASRKEHAIVNNTSLSSQGVGEGPRPPKGGGRSRGDQIPHPPRTGAGDARRAGLAFAARLGGGGRRDGPVVGFPPGFAGAWRALPAGGPVEHARPRPRRAAAGLRGAGPPASEPVRAAGPASRGVRGRHLDHDRGA